MMILATLRLFALGALLAGSAAPLLAQTPQSAAAPVDTGPRSMAAAGGENRDASRSRRVELPFPLEFRAPDREPRAPARQADTGPHPFRETLFKRASWPAPAVIHGRRLSRLPEFS